MAKIADVIKLKTGYANFVELKSAFEESQQNSDRMAMYRPTTAHRKAFDRLCRGLYQANDKKFYLLSGSYGTGKSHLSLMFANFLSRSSGDVEIKGFYDNYEKLDKDQAQKLRNLRKGGQYLVAICDYYSGKRFEDTVLKAIFEACDKMGLKAGVETEFDEAERLLLGWEKKSGTPSSIRNHFEDFTKALEQVAPNWSVEQLRAGLKSYDSESMERFREAYKKAQDVEFQAQSGNLVAIVQRLVKSKEFKERFKGLAILFDEFGFTLEKAAYSKDVLQGFMEKVCQNEPNVFFLGCIHKDFKAYADRFSQADAAVMSARITHVDLLNEGIEEIIGAIVETDKNSAIWQKEILPKISVLDSLLPTCNSLDLFPWIDDLKRIRQKVLEDIYGVHPMALSCLLKLSSDVGSDARSTFTFFSGEVGGAEGSYADFIKGADTVMSTGKLNLFTVDKLFNFFKKELSPKNEELRDRHRQLVNGYVASIDALRKSLRDEFFSFDEDTDQRMSVLRAILIYNLCQIPTTVENIQFGLYCLTSAEKNQVEKHLKSLDKAGAVFYRKQSNTYELAVGSGDDPYDLVEKYLKNTDLHPTDLVGEYLKESGISKNLQFLDARQYNLPYNEDKRFLRKFVRAKDMGKKLWEEVHDELVRNSTKEKDSYEGVAVYAICEDEAEIQLAKSSVADIPYDEITVGIPHNPQPFIETLLKVKACRHYLDSSSKEKLNAQTESRLRDIFDDPNDGFLTVLQKKMREVSEGGAACWYGKSGRVVFDKPQQPQKPVDVLVEELYKNRCKIKHVDLNIVHDDNWRTGKNNALKQAVINLLNSDAVQIDNGNPDNHGDKRYLEKVLLKAGALRKTVSDGPVAFFTCESDPNKISDDFPVFKELCKKVASLKPGIDFHLGSFLEQSRKAPYGVGGSALMLSVAHVVRAFGERLRIYKDSTKTAELRFDDYNTLASAVSDLSTKIVFELRDITEAQKKLIERTSAAVGAKPLKHGELRSISETYEVLQEWWNKIPHVAKIIEIYEEKDRNRLKQLIQAFNTIGKNDRYDFVLNTLPATYTGGPVDENISEKEVSSVCKELATDVKKLESGLQRVTNMLAEAVCDVFGSKGDIVQCEELTAKWFNQLNPTQRDSWKYSNDPDAEALVKHLRDGNSSFETKILKYLPWDFGLEEVADWSSLRTNDFVSKLRQAKAVVEAAAVEVAVPVVEGQGNAKKNGSNAWKMDDSSSLKVIKPDKAASIIYTTNGHDPKISSDRKTVDSDVVLKDIFNDCSGGTLLIRALDSDGNFSDLLSLTVVNKEKEFEVGVRGSNLFVKEAFFKFPESLDDLKTVLRSIVNRADKEKVIDKKQADKLIKSIDEI